MSFKQHHHLLWRAGFGPQAAQLNGLPALPQLFRQLQTASAQAPQPLDVVPPALQQYNEPGAGLRLARLSDAERRAIRVQQVQGVKALNLAWLEQLVQSPAQLREKFAFFWHGHFATRSLNVVQQQALLHTIRTHALGSFRTLLHAVAKSGAVLNFLNAAQNRKDHPNENFAREVMELFTLGRGHYTETDIREAARGFTGWGANYRGDFQFRPAQHDGGSKTIFGRTALFNGEAVLDLLLEQEQCARFITEKIYRFFVNDTPDATRIKWLAGRFYQSGYNIGKLAEDIFTSDWFYAPQNIGTRIKSPVELLAGMQRMLPVAWQKPEGQLVVQQVLGQALFYPPNVAGWPGGKAWIDASSLLTRMRLPLQLLQLDDTDLKAKDDDDQQMGRATGRMGRLLQGQVDWQPLLSAYEKTGRTELLAAIATSLLQTNKVPHLQLLQSATDSSSREAFIQSATARVMALPEYQLC